MVMSFKNDAENDRAKKSAEGQWAKSQLKVR